MKTGNYDVGLALMVMPIVLALLMMRILWADQPNVYFLPIVIDDGDDHTFDVKCSQSLEEMISRYGGNPIMWKTGHSLIRLKDVRNWMQVWW